MRIIHWQHVISLINMIDEAYLTGEECFFPPLQFHVHPFQSHMLSQRRWMISLDRKGLFFSQGYGVVVFPHQNLYSSGSQTSAFIRTMGGDGGWKEWVLTYTLQGSPLRVSFSCGRGQIICISNRFSGVVVTAGLGTILGEPLFIQ